jgi:phage shock protein PspC (stress-responsive transcriptional regulator)
VKEIILDGLAPTFDYHNTLVVLGFEVCTLLIELAVIWRMMKMSGADNRRMRYALCGSMLSNLVSFTVGALLYTYFFGSGWLITFNGGIYFAVFDEQLAEISSIVAILFPIWVLAFVLYSAFCYTYPDTPTEQPK